MAFLDLTDEDLDMLEYQAVALLEAVYVGRGNFGDIRIKENRQGYLEAPLHDFDDQEEAEKVQMAVKHLRSSFGG